MPRFEVNIERDAVTLAALEKTLDTRQILEPVARKIIAFIQLGFKVSTSPYGEKWAPLRFRNGQPLRDNKLLQNSFVPRYGQDFVEIGTNRVGARVHQFGATIVPVHAKMLRFFAKGSTIPIFAKSVTIPARPFMPLDSAGNLVLPAVWGKSFLAIVRAKLEGKNAGAV